jgi:hypothetical protein
MGPDGQRKSPLCHRRVAQEKHIAIAEIPSGQRISDDCVIALIELSKKALRKLFGAQMKPNFLQRNDIRIEGVQNAKNIALITFVAAAPMHIVGDDGEPLGAGGFKLVAHE